MRSVLENLDGRYEESLRDLARYPRDVVDQGPIYLPRSLLAGLTHVAMNDRAPAHPQCEAARGMLEKEIAREPRDARKRAAMGLTLACLGRREEAIREARLAADSVPVTRDAIDGPYYQENLARVYAAVGEADAACDILEKQLAIPSGTVVSILRLDPAWAPLRTFPRVRTLIGQSLPAKTSDAR